ncbi:MAG: hypothetical protein GY851_11910 [bacterium]|nr:hypothetical protein [bacterium]
MICDNRHPSASVTTNLSASIRLIRVEREPLTEYFLTALPETGRSTQALLSEVAKALHHSDTQIISQDVFASVASGRSVRDALENTLGQPQWPVTWIDAGDGQGFAGTQVWAVSGTDVRSLARNGHVTGRLFEDRYATYCRLGGLSAPQMSQTRGRQASDVLRQMEETLSAGKMHFAHTLRTWFYLDDILSWYGDFNQVRDAFFREHNVFNGLVPASTGIGAANVSRSALVAGLLAAKPKNGCMKAMPVPSPLQCPAIDYGSSFSRAVELDLPDHRRLFISGTASIAPEGDTIHVGHVGAQTAKTMEVVAAILESRGMEWTDVTRGIAYVRNAIDIPVYTCYCHTHGLPLMPVVPMNSTICRDDLLFELEVDAITAR